MQLDRNGIAIRERNYADVLDLALRVIRAYALPLAAAFVVGVAPAMCLNAWLLADYVTAPGDGEFPSSYLWTMLLLVLWEAPVATAPITLYLGQALFVERPRAGSIARSFAGSLPQLIVYQVLLRGLLLPLVVTWLVLFAAWPYFSEVILLERNPLRTRRGGQMSTYRRTQVLHDGSFGDLFGRWLAAVAVGVLLLLSLWLSLLFGVGVLVSEWPKEAAFSVFYPLALWLVIGYLSVVRFLSYLDLRIRREGWEVELMMRAEGARLTRGLT